VTTNIESETSYDINEIIEQILYKAGIDTHFKYEYDATTIK